jgi:hypothetical protein
VAKENLTKAFNGSALYLPAIQSHYASFCVQQKLSEKSNGRMPSKLKPKDLDWFNAKNKLFDYDYGLYSAGQFNKAFISKPDMVLNRAQGKIIVGDSGGYQVGTGKLAGTKHLNYANPQAVYEAWMGGVGDKTLAWVVDWLDLNVDYAMVLEIPLWAAKKGNNDSPFRKLSFQQIIDATERNIQFIIDRRGAVPGASAKFINIMHDLSEEDAGTAGLGEIWYEQIIKPYRFEGIAFGGASAGDLTSLLYWLRRMADDGVLNDCEWIHCLGLSQLQWAPVLTAIQRTLRKLLENNITVSFDSSSPFQFAGKYSKMVDMPNLTSDPKSWSFTPSDIPQDLKYAQGKTEYPFPYDFSPLSQYVTLNDFHQKQGITKERFLSTVSYNLATSHNVYTYLKGFAEANRLTFGVKANTQFVPSHILEIVDCIDEFFVVENWKGMLAKNRKLFLRTGKRGSAVEREDEV